MSSRVITGNINEEYRKATSKAVAFEGLPSDIQKRMKRKSVSGLTVDRVADQFYNPFLQTTEIEVPKDRKERNRWYRYFFLNEPIVHSALTLHTMFPLSSFRVSHEDKEIEDSFNEMIEDIRLFDFILEMGLEYWITGECFPFGFFDNPDDPKMWTDFILLHPNFVEVEGDPWVRGKRKKHIWLTPTDGLKKIVEAGPNDPKTGSLYRNLPSDTIEGVKNGKMELGEVQVSHVKRPGMYFNTRGTSIIDCILKPLMYRDKLRSAQYCWVENAELLTEHGWKKCDTLSYDDNIATLNPTTNYLEYQKPTEIIMDDYDGPIVQFEFNNRINIAVTPNHRLWVKPRQYSHCTPTGFGKKPYTYSRYKLGDWQFVDAKDVTICSKTRSVIDGFNGVKPPEEIKIGANIYTFNDYMQIVGYYISEGSAELLPYKKGRLKNKRVTIYQSKKSIYWAEMKHLFEKYGWVSWYSKTTNIGKFQISDNAHAEHFAKLFGHSSYTKCIDTGIKMLAPQYLELLLQTAVNGDGNRRVYDKTGKVRVNYATVSQQLADDIQEIVFKCGYKPVLSKYTDKQVHMHKIYWALDKQGDRRFQNLRAGSKSIMPYTGKVWCVSVPNGIIITRLNGCISIHGNSIADRHISPSEFYFIGEQGDPADEDELEKFQNALVASWTQPNRAIIWHHAVRVQWEGASGKILPLQPEFDMIDNQILTGLMVSKGIIFAEGPTFANSSVALDILIQRYLSFRMQIEKWLENCVFAPICKIHGLYKPTQAEIKHRIRIEGKDKPLWIPQVKWDKENLRDNMQKLDFMFRLADKNIVPWKMITDLLDFDWEKIKKGMDDQRKDLSKAGLPTAPKAPGGLSPLGLPIAPELGGGGAPGAVSPVGAGGLPTLPGAKPTPLEGGGPIPPESHVSPGIPVG